jgi:hypothetical protein
VKIMGKKSGRKEEREKGRNGMKEGSKTVGD